MKKIKTCVTVVLLLLLPLLAPSLIQPVKASPNYWYAPWLDYQWNVNPEGVHQPVVNLSTATTVYSGDESQWVKTALVVSVYDYEPYVSADRVVFRVVLYYDSFADETMLPVPAATVTLNVQKDLDDSNFNDHRMKVETSGDEPGFAQGDGLDQSSYLDSTQSNRRWWAVKALAYGAGLFCEPIGVVTGLISLANAFAPAGVDYDNAGYSETGLYSWWHDPGYDFGTNRTLRQYAFNTIEWIQHPVNPSNFYGIKVWAHVVLHTQHNLIGPSIDTAPVYLRIHRSHALSISATSGGNTDPAPGCYHCIEGMSEAVTASAYSGYTFDYWILDGATKYANPITVTMNSDHDLKAYFEYTGVEAVAVARFFRFTMERNTLKRA